MKSKTAALNTAMAFILMTGLSAVAQGPDDRRGGQGRPLAPAIDTALDADGNQTISAEEIANASTALIELDLDYDEGLTLAECMGFSSQGGQQAPPAGRGRQPPMPPSFSALDTSGDEIIDGYEISSAPESLLALDSNGDGVLQSDEYMPSRPNGGMGGRPIRYR